MRRLLCAILAVWPRLKLRDIIQSRGVGKQDYEGPLRAAEDMLLLNGPSSFVTLPEVPEPESPLKPRDLSPGTSSTSCVARSCVEQ